MNEYAREIRRELHMYPEVGFDLARTLALLRRELDTIGVDYTEEYGKSSIVATVNPEKTNFTVGIRADIDALPIQEANDVAYRSQNEGKMHACGHDAHTAIALATVKRLFEMRNEINCRVKVMFQAAEEYSTSGAKLMVEDGVMEDIDCAVALHCDAGYDAGCVALASGEQNAISHGFRLHFYGTSAHAADQHTGADAIMMAVRAYTSIEMMVAKEVDACEPAILNIGAIHGGETNNIVCDACSMFGTLRTYRAEVDERIMSRIQAICEATALSGGGSFVFEEVKFYPVVCNDPTVTACLKKSAERAIGEDRVLPMKKRSMSGEDFSYMAQEKPSAMFRLGIRNEARGITAGLHQVNFDIDENALDIGVNVFVRFVLDHMNGIDNLPEKGHRV